MRKFIRPDLNVREKLRHDFLLKKFRLVRLSTIGRWRSADSFMEIPNSASAYCELDGRESMDIETKAESWYRGKHFPISWGYACGYGASSAAQLHTCIK